MHHWIGFSGNIFTGPHVFFCLTIKYRGFLQDFPYTNPMNAEPGPPGMGKSTTAAHLICQLLRRQRWGAAVGTLVAVVFFFFRDEIWDESDDIDDGLWLLKSATWPFAKVKPLMVCCPSNKACHWTGPHGTQNMT
jgi:hypothetical protein